MDASPMPVPNHHPFLHNPHSPPPVPPVLHKVWILDCRECNMFLTNRGMKAVLLLRPNVSLFSSDILPINCSAYSANPDVLCSTSTHNPNPSPRTCECLTQSLCCHGCGNTIGYMIVVPCIRCTSSITVSNRATNGHRFVFHPNEVSGTERYYVQDEPGVLPFDPLLTVSPTPPNPWYSFLPQSSYPSQTQTTSSAGPSSHVSRGDYLPTTPAFLSPRPLEYRVQSPSRSRSRSPLHDLPTQSSSFPISHRTSADSLTSGNRSPSPPLRSNLHPVDHKEPPLVAPSLKPGDVIFWHHLARTGEIPKVNDDGRARQPSCTKRGREMFFDR